MTKRSNKKNQNRGNNLNKTRKSTPNKRKIKKVNYKGKGAEISKNKGVIVGLILITILFIVYLFVTNYYKEHFFNKTTINGVSVSKMTEEEASVEINSRVDNYSLTIVSRNQNTDRIMGSDIGLHNIFAKDVSNLLEEQNAYSWPIGMFKEHQLETDTSTQYDKSLLEEKVRNLSVLKEENNIMPTNAYISEYGEEGYKLIEADNGSFIKEEDLMYVVENGVDNFKEIIDLEEEGIYLEPEITSEYEPLVTAYNEMNKLAGASITYLFGDVAEILDGKTTNQWISKDENYNVTLDENKIVEYVDYIGSTYNTFGKTRTFKTSYGNVITVKGGDYGWWLDRPTEVTQVTEIIKNGEKLIKEPAYRQTAQQYGDDDIGNTYVEVNKTAQHLFFYKDGVLVVESDFVSGNESKGYGTPVGTYPVQYKDKDAVLVGEDYATPVEYWMPFNHNIGFHDADWRSSFGGNIYKTSGSHGCINMPPANAKTMFEHIERGVAVVVYE